MKATHTTQQEIAEGANLSGQSAISQFLKSRNMRVDNLLIILDACGYELVARSRDGSTPEYVIGNETATGENRESMDARIRNIVAEELAKAGWVPGQRKK
jgi:transcriptional regulator with XRE-family HTH domain